MLFVLRAGLMQPFTHSLQGVMGETTVCRASHAASILCRDGLLCMGCTLAVFASCGSPVGFQISRKYAGICEVHLQGIVPAV